jgi:hypothetical protein
MFVCSLTADQGAHNASTKRQLRFVQVPRARRTTPRPRKYLHLVTLLP